MNYREWLLFRAQQYKTETGEPEVLRYTTWQNYQAVRDWIRRSDAAQLMNFAPQDSLAGTSLS